MNRHGFLDRNGILVSVLSVMILMICSVGSALAQEGLSVASIPLKYSDAEWKLAGKPIVQPCDAPRLATEGPDSYAVVRIFEGTKAIMTYYFPNPRLVSVENKKLCNEKSCDPVNISVDENGLAREINYFDLSVPVSVATTRVAFYEDPRTQSGIAIDLEEAQGNLARTQATQYVCQPPDFRCPNGEKSEDCGNQVPNQ